MPKLPYMQLYVAEFMIDIQTLDLQNTGAWTILLLFMWRNSQDGTIRLSDDELGNLWKTKAETAHQMLNIMRASNLFDYSYDEKTCQNIITSRRMSRDRKRLKQKHDWANRQIKDTNKTNKRQKLDRKISDIRYQISDKEYKDSSSNSRLTDFEIFWQDYPRKVGKGAARKAWNQAIKKAREGEIILGLRSAKKSFDWYKDGGQFIPYPATWLNQERWLDEVRESPAPPASSPAEIESKKKELADIAQREWERLHPIDQLEPDDVPF